MKKLIVETQNLLREEEKEIQDFVAGITPNFDYLLESEEQEFISWVCLGENYMLQNPPQTHFSGGYYRQLAEKIYYKILNKK